MKNTVVNVLAVLSMSLAALAADPAAAQAPSAVKSEAERATGTAQQQQANRSVDNQAAARASKERSSQMAACRRQVAERGLGGTAYRTALADCTKQMQ
jgi:ABC-type transporter MlaC component